MPVGIEAEAGDPVLAVLGADRLQDADRHHVLGFLQRLAHRHRPVEGAAVVLRLPRLAAGGAGIEEQGAVVDHGGGREAFLQCGRVDEGLEARSRLAPGLRDVVELVLAEVEAADERLDCAAARIERNEGALHLGNLGDLPGVLRRLDDTDHRAAPQPDVGRGLVAQARLGGAQALAGDLDPVAAGPHRHDLLRAGLQYHGGEHVAVVGAVGQGVVDRLVQLAAAGRQHDEFLGAAVDLAALVVHQALAQGAVGGVLVARIHRGVDVQAAGVGLAAVLREDQLAHHLGDVLCMDAGGVGAGADLQLFGARLLRLVVGDEAGFLHPVDDVELSAAGTARVVDRVVGGGGLGQASQHRRFGHGDLLQRLAEVGLRRGGEAIGAVAQVDLVHVDLEDPIFREQVFQLEGQQDLVDLAGEGLLGRQVHVARHLHRDGRGALALGAVQVRQAGPHDSLVIHPAVAVEAGVFGRQHRVDHHLGDVCDRGEVASLLAEFAQQRAFGGVDPQRQLGPVVGQIGDIGQVGIGHGQRHRDDQHQRNRGRHDQAHHRQQGAQHPGEPARVPERDQLFRWWALWRALWRVRRFRGRGHCVSLWGSRAL